MEGKMSMPLNSSDQNKIQAVESALGQYIKQAELGKSNTKDLSSIQQQLKSILNNPQIPDSVQQSLQAAANELKQVQSGSGNIANLYSAKMQVDSLLTTNESETLGDKSDQKLGGGSLGGGSEEQ
jgi:hypothetical protein